MSIPALGGGANAALQRALMEAAERALADDLQLLAGSEGTAGTAGTTGAAGRVRPGRQPATTSSTAERATAESTVLAEAIVVELGEAEQAGELTVAGGWITTPRRPAGPSAAGAPERPATAHDTLESTSEPEAPAAGQRRAAEPAIAGAPRLDRLVAMLKQTGIDFRDAVQVLREIRPGEPLPTRSELRALWAAAPEGAPAPGSAVPATPRPDIPADLLVRERGWHRAGEREHSAEHVLDAAEPQHPGPSLATVAQPTPPNQTYVAGLSTAEFQRLVTVLGAAGAPAWFWQVRDHGGLRGLVERPGIARLHTTRFAGTRLSAWLLAVLGMALLWYVGIHTRIWW